MLITSKNFSQDRRLKDALHYVNINMKEINMQTANTY